VDPAVGLPETDQSRDLIQLFALSAVALLISVLGELVLAVVLMMLPLGFAAVLKALPFAFVLVAKTSAGQDLVVFLWAATAGAAVELHFCQILANHLPWAHEYDEHLPSRRAQGFCGRAG